MPNSFQRTFFADAVSRHRLLLEHAPQPLTDVLVIMVDCACAPKKRESCDSLWGHRTTLAKQWIATVEAVNLVAAEQKLPPICPDLKLYCARHTFATDMLACSH